MKLSYQSRKMEVAKTSLTLSIFLAILGLPQTDGKFTFSENIISFKDIPLMKHTDEFPILTLGKGTFDAIEISGNFEIDDQVNEFVNFEPKTHQEDGDDLLVEFVPSTIEDDSKVILRLKSNGEILFDTINVLGLNLNRWFIRLIATEDEHLWGGGEQYTYLNLRNGGNYPIWTREQGVGRNKSSTLTQLMDLIARAGGDYHTSYWPQPSFLSSRGYHFELTFPTYSELDLAPMNEDVARGHVIYWHYEFNEEFPCRTCKIVITAEETLMKTVQKINPGQPELPEWVYNGAIIGVQGGTDRMLDVLDQALENNVAVSGLWIQDWSGKITTEFGTRVFWNWRWNSTWYPNLDQVIKDLKEEKDIRVTAYITPHMNNAGDIFEENVDTDYYWLKDKNDGSILSQDFGEFNVSTVDIIKHDPDCNCLNSARIWYKELIKTNLIDLGLSGWMADFGEYTPMNAKTGFPGRWWGQEYSEILHSFIPQHWASLNREVVEQNGKLGDILFWMRSGGIESKYHQVMSWAGDQTVDWTRSDGLPSSIVAALSLAVSGMGLSHSDIGGYTSVPQLGDTGPVRDKELLLRWAEYSAFTPLMRTHETNKPAENVQIYDDPDILQKFGRLTRIYKTLKPYIKNAVAQNANEGIPVMRPLFLQFPNDTNTYNLDHQYMFGDDLLVAPVLEPGVTDWNVYLPGPQKWRYLWEAEFDGIDGPQPISVYAPLGFPPVFFNPDSPFADLFMEIYEKFGF